MTERASSPRLSTASPFTAGFSVAVFGAYLLGLGTVLLLIPNVLLGIFGIPDTNEVWIRILGGVLAALGYLYVEGGRAGSEWFIRASVFSRAGVAAVLFALVLVRVAPTVITLFGLVDLAAATWTAYAIGWLRGWHR
jgi:hypothetical protein